MFADATDDHQWIHVDPGARGQWPVRRDDRSWPADTVAAAALHSQLYTVDNIAMAINYGYNKVRFITPVKVGAKIRARAEITKVDQLDGCGTGDRDDDRRDRGFGKAGRRGGVDRPLHRLRRRKGLKTSACRGHLRVLARAPTSR